MPTSVLLAVLAAAGLLALAPALVRRYDATERLEAERAQSSARVLSRTRRKRTVPGRRPVNPSRVAVATLRAAAPPAGGQVAAPSAGEQPTRRARASAARVTTARTAAVRSAAPRAGSGRGRQRPRRIAPAAPRPAPERNRRRAGALPAIYRRRRVLLGLMLLNLVELVGVATVGPGFWVGFAVTFTLLAVFLCYLRYLAMADQRRRRAEARHRAWLAARQAEVRREQVRRAAARRAAARRMAEQRELLRRSPAGWSAPPTVSYRRASGDGTVR